MRSQERVAFALENAIVLQGMGLLCAVGRYVGLSMEEMHDMFDAVADSIDSVIEEAENHECEKPKPKLSIVKDKKHKH
jgi:hypothetical protein